MPRIYEAATGRPVEVSDAEAPALLASGKFGFAGDTVALVGPTGQVIGLKADSPNILDALGSGFRIETPDEGKLRLQQAKYGDSEGLAALAGAGRGLTFGLSDVALTKTGLVAPETLEGLRAANPTATALGDIDVNAEHILSHVGAGALLGGAAGGQNGGQGGDD